MKNSDQIIKIENEIAEDFANIKIKAAGMTDVLDSICATKNITFPEHIKGKTKQLVKEMKQKLEEVGDKEFSEALFKTFLLIGNDNITTEVVRYYIDKRYDNSDINKPISLVFAGKNLAEMVGGGCMLILNELKKGIERDIPENDYRVILRNMIKDEIISTSKLETAEIEILGDVPDSIGIL